MTASHRHPHLSDFAWGALIFLTALIVGLLLAAALT